MMRIFAPVIVLGLASPALADTAANPGDQCIETPANAEAFGLARDIAEAVLPAGSSEDSMRTIMAAIGTQMRNGMADDLKDPGLTAILDKRLAELPDRLMPITRRFIPVQKAAMACAYTHEYSLNELRDLKAFSQTLTGNHYLASNVKIIADPAVAKANQGYFHDLQSVQQGFAADVVADVQAYEARKKANRGN